MENLKNFNSVSAIWGDEKKTVVDCAERAYYFMQILKKHNQGLFMNWFEKAENLKEALECKVEISQIYFNKKFKNNWRERHHLGSRVSLWTGHIEDGHSAAISFDLGGYPDNPNIPNSCVVNLPREGEYSEYYKKTDNQIALLNLMQEYWQPDFLKVNGERIKEIA